MKLYAIVTVTLLIVSCTCAAPSIQDNRIESDSGSSFSRAAKYLASCFESDDISTCLAVKGITALNRAARSNNIELINGVTFKRDPTSVTQRNGKSLTENDVYAELPAAADDRSGRLIDMAVQSAVDFFNTHNLEVKVPTEATQQVARALDEGRGKLKKMIGPLALAIGAKVFALLPLFLFGLALFTIKAVFVAKIALLLAFLVGGSRLFGGFGGLGNKFGGNVLGGGYSANGWNSGATGGWSSGASSAYPYARSINNGADADTDAQELAYGGQVAAAQ